ncbi:hypothetical protein L1987_39136 [Smallanthus sonchifolius]|uniref:Uncharacterized protein n=1 Tax=Smallanthus sonchifolius TaxID=185202 RepID=A0ACB9HMK7_9ASTR|nr:hypothetical protein L1987_39136 [Smallanthus sonchifolius]
MTTGAVSTQATMVAPFTGLRSSATFPTIQKTKSDFSSLPSNGGRVQCMKAQLAKEVDYLLRNKWVPCLEFELEHGFVYRENHRSPGYYDGRYWTMWKLPMFGCTDSSQVLKELNECKKEYPVSWIRIIGFDNVRQVQCINEATKMSFMIFSVIFYGSVSRRTCLRSFLLFANIREDDYSLIPFELFNSWLQLDDFDQAVIDSWREELVQHASNAWARFKQRMKRLKMIIKDWNNNY